MKRSLLAAVTMMAAIPAFAQEIPDEAHKAWALKRAYELNGNSMVGGCNPFKCESIDLSRERPPSGDPPKIVDAAPPQPETKNRSKRKP